jgi:uncharacterized protein YbcV (DUF1398 family)
VHIFYPKGKDMEIKQTILNIAKESKEQKWPFPKTFEALMDAGVRSYTVRVSDCNRLYDTSEGELHDMPLEGFKPLAIAHSFSKQGILDALQLNREKKTDYLGFLSNIAKSGVSHYIVNMADRSVTYFDSSETKFHKEYVPVWK